MTDQSLSYSLATNYPFGENSSLRNSFHHIRRKIIKLPHTPTPVSALIDESVRIISHGLERNVRFFDEKLNPNAGDNTYSTYVSINDTILGTLLIDNRDRLFENANAVTQIEEVAELLALTLTYAQQREELQNLETESEDMLQFAPDIILVVDADNRVRMGNRKAAEFCCAPSENVADCPLTELLGTSAPDYTQLLSCGQQQRPVEIEVSNAHGRRIASFNLSLVNQDDGSVQVLMVGRDITTERQAELALRNSERATMMSQTIDYLLHEVNNPLAALLSNVAYANRKKNQALKLVTSTESNPLLVQTVQQLDRSLSGARNSGARLSEAMEMLRASNKKRALCRPQPIDVGAELSMAVSAIEADHKNITISKRFTMGVSVDAPPLHLAEIFGAVLKNAVQSCEGTDGNREVAIAGNIRHRRLVIHIDDDGPGVPENMRDHIFMPFFTTKPLEHAIGLGLSMARDMLKRVDGEIKVNDASPLGGARFTITIPQSTARSVT